MAQAKSIGAITLYVEDLDRSREFYERAFGITGIVEEDAGTVILELGNLFLRLLTRVEAEKEMLGQVPLADSSGVNVQLAVHVEEAGAAASELAESGVTIVYGPVDRPWGVRHSAFRDPDGHLWVLSSDIPED
jgi:lactoylglutathione lyase